MGSVIDALRRVRIKRGPAYMYHSFGSFSRSIGTGVIPLSPSGSLVCNVAVIQASLANTDTVYIGGHGLSATTGLELTAGQAILFSSAPPSPMDQKAMMAALGAGLMPYLQYMEPGEAQRQVETLADQRAIRFVIDLEQVFVLAASGTQTVRVMFTQDIQMP